MSATADAARFFTARHETYERFTFPAFPPSAYYLSPWGHVVVAER